MAQNWLERFGELTATDETGPVTRGPRVDDALDWISEIDIHRRVTHRRVTPAAPPRDPIAIKGRSGVLDATPEPRANSAGNKNPPDESRANTEYLPQTNIRVPLFPPLYQEQENRNRERTVTPQKDKAYSCSRDMGDMGETADRATATPHAGNMYRSRGPMPCTGCHARFTPATDGASQTLCRVCQAEVRRGYG
jgi:hypothetical protein